MIDKKTERVYVLKISALLNKLVETDERLVSEFSTMISINKSDFVIKSIELAGVGVAFASMGLYHLTHEHFPYLSAFASCTISRMVEDVRRARASENSNYISHIEDDISNQLNEHAEAEFIKKLETHSRAVVHKSITSLSSNRHFIKKIEGLQKQISQRKFAEEFTTI